MSIVLQQVHDCSELMEAIQRIGLLPVLDSGVPGFSADELVVPECRYVDFVYPTDKHGNRYGWGWALLTTPERLFSPAACQCPRTPEESLERLLCHLRKLLPQATEKQLEN